MDNKLKLCKFLLQKYGDIINEREKRTIGEIKALVDGSDLSIQSLAQDFMGDNYSFESDYENTLKEVYKFVVDEISFVDADLNLNYWMSPKEVLEQKVADDEDFAVFMCSLMKALKDDKAEVIIAELDNLRTHAFITTELGNKFLLLDPSQGKPFEEFYGEKTEVLAKYSFNGNKIKTFLYKFNSDKYEQFLE
jgi:superfamily I DNA and RNA helicase